MRTLRGDEITRTDENRHKFADAMAEYLWGLTMDSSQDDERGNVDEFGIWGARFGRHVLFTDSRGFVWRDRYSTEREADDALAELEADREPNCDDDGHDFGPVTGSRMGGAFVQYCQRVGCRVVCALADDDEINDGEDEDR